MTVKCDSFDISKASSNSSKHPGARMLNKQRSLICRQMSQSHLLFLSNHLSSRSDEHNADIKYCDVRRYVRDPQRISGKDNGCMYGTCILHPKKMYFHVVVSKWTYAGGILRNNS